MMQIDVRTLFSEIKNRRPKSILLVAPDGLLNSVQKVAFKIQEELHVETFVSGEACYGICDLKESYAKQLGAELVFNIGHTAPMDKIGKSTILIDAFDDIQFDKIIRKAEATLKSFKNIGICTLSQYLPALDEAKRLFQEMGFKVMIGVGGRLSPGQVFGCEFESVYGIREKVDVFVFLGQSRFHAIGVALSTARPTFMLDPYLEEIVDIRDLAEVIWKKALLAVYKTRDIEVFGIIVGLREGQMRLNQALDIKRELEMLGKQTQLIALSEITPERINTLRFDAFIQTACPRISIDSGTFKKPILSIPQAQALIQVLKRREPNNFLTRAHWH